LIEHNFLHSGFKPIVYMYLALRVVFHLKKWNHSFSCRALVTTLLVQLSQQRVWKCVPFVTKLLSWYNDVLDIECGFVLFIHIPW